MLPSSFAVILAGLATVALALGAFVWAWRRGQFTELDAQAHVILDERDLRLERPWESAAQRLERATQHGELLSPTPGEWGEGWAGEGEGSATRGGRGEGERA
ncbi:MAG TPA: cbb3-type cytochrome oxidase assembly protein [Gemmatimonadaceae bacterium]